MYNTLGWLRDANANKIGEAFCKICRLFLRAHLTDLQRHASTKMHCEKMKKLNPQQNNQTVLRNTSIQL